MGHRLFRRVADVEDYGKGLPLFLYTMLDSGFLTGFITSSEGYKARGSRDVFHAAN